MRKFMVSVNGKTYEVDVEEIGGSVQSAPVQTASPAPAAAPAAPAPKPAAAPAAPAAVAVAGANNVTAPMPGNILKVNVSAGDTVKKGDCLVVLEAMKMENEILAPVDGKIVAVNIQKGSTVNSGDVMISIS